MILARMNYLKLGNITHAFFVDLHLEYRLFVFQVPEDSDDSSEADDSSDDDTMGESPKAGPSRKRSRADENDDGGISQQMERLQLQDFKLQLRYKFIFLTDSISLLHNLPKILLPNIQYLFANTSKSEP